MRRLTYRFSLGFLISLGLIIVFFATQRGTGLFADSASYIFGARAVLKGQGFVGISGWNQTTPVIAWPPLFPALLAMIGTLGIDPVIGARILNTFLFGANVALMGFILMKSTAEGAPGLPGGPAAVPVLMPSRREGIRAGGGEAKRSRPLTRSPSISLLGSFLFLISIPMLEVHSAALSEPAFLFLGFLGLFLLAHFLEDNRKFAFLLASALSIGLAYLDRYAGVSMVIAGMVGLLLFDKKRFVPRMLDAAVFMVISCLPMILWLIRNHYAASRPTELTFAFDPHLLGYLRYLFATISMWLLPKSVPSVARGIVLLVAIVSLIWSSIVAGRAGTREDFLLRLFVTFIFSHLGVYVMTAAFFVSQDPDNRALSPVLFAVIVWVLTAAHQLWTLPGKRSGLRAGLVVAAVFLAGPYLLRGTEWIFEAAREGRGYASTTWKNSEIIHRIQSFPQGTPIYTNGWDVIYLLTGRPACGIPTKIEKYRAAVNHFRTQDSYSAELAKIEKLLRDTDGLIVYLDRITWRWYYPSELELQERLPLELVVKADDGAIYKVKK